MSDRDGIFTEHSSHLPPEFEAFKSNVWMGTGGGKGRKVDVFGIRVFDKENISINDVFFVCF